MTDTRSFTDPASPTSGASDSPEPATATAQPNAPAPDQPVEPDYKALYEQAQTKLTRAEQAAREHKTKATRLDEIEAAQQSETEKAAKRAEAAEQQVAALRRQAADAEIRAA